MSATLAIVPILTFLATHRPVVVTWPPEAQSVVRGSEYGPGVKRLDPGTVNLPLTVGPTPCGASLRRQSTVFWFKTAPSKGPARPGSRSGRA
ncbi:MAG: hypothetical protein JST30_05605 [Armatimonadetes bacterium]|nr:hypothetical protein [Armatimonadota bacterium]